MTTVNKQISLGTDDCDEVNDSTVRTGNNQVYGGSTTSSVVDIGLRWQSVSIAQATTITSATLSVYLYNEVGALGANIRGIDEDNTATWSAASRPSQRTKTTATITANEANWGNWGTGNWATIDITSVVQEIVNRAGWSSNNALAIVIEDTLGTGANNYCAVSAYEQGDGTYAAKLDIVYSSTPTINKQISASHDDCRETDDTSIDLSGTAVQAGCSPSESYDAGLRWQSVDLGQGVTITSATLSLYQTADAGALAARIRGIDEDNTAAWSAGSRPSQRTKTTATITAGKSDWTNYAVNGWATIDITSVVQEIVNRAGWSSNNALAVVIENIAGSGTNYIRARSYDYAGHLHGAKLDIVYVCVEEYGAASLSHVQSLALEAESTPRSAVPLSVYPGVEQVATSSQYAAVALAIEAEFGTFGSDATTTRLELLEGMVPVATSHQYASVALAVVAYVIPLGVRGWDVSVTVRGYLELGWSQDAVHTVYTTAAIVRKRFRFVSADILHDDIEQYITEAEGIIDATMKASFLDSFDVTKHQVIRNCASDLAGLACITYDQSDYPTVEAAAVTANFLYDQSRLSLLKLSDQRLVEYLKSL